MTTIAYDRPVKDLIAGLDATGHVTHTQYRKTHVTLHHNGGRLSHEGVLSVWQTRPASAHFDVDAPGDVAQYVRLNEYAWATGNTDGNVRSISIEMCNETVGPEWKVGETTWRSAARLAGWIFARVIGTRPTYDTLVVHKYWSSTDCAGPYIDKVFAQILALAQHHYDNFVRGIAEDIIGKANGMITIVKGDQNPAHWVVELKGDGSVTKCHIPSEEILNVIKGLTGLEVRERPQFEVDYVTELHV